MADVSHKVFCEVDSLLTSAGVDVYHAHQDLQYNNPDSARLLIDSSIANLQKAKSLICPDDSSHGEKISGAGCQGRY